MSKETESEAVARISLVNTEREMGRPCPPYSTGEHRSIHLPSRTVLWYAVLNPGGDAADTLWLVVGLLPRGRSACV
jgi:hypothetical protein